MKSNQENDHEYNCSEFGHEPVNFAGLFWKCAECGVIHTTLESNCSVDPNHKKWCATNKDEVMDSDRIGMAVVSTHISAMESNEYANGYKVIKNDFGHGFCFDGEGVYTIIIGVNVHDLVHGS